jgi:uncharacterized membrane protein YhhN
MVNKLNLYIYYSILAMLYLATLPFAPYPGSFILKTLPIYLLIFFAFYQKRIEGSVLLLGGIVFCSIGDVWLDLDAQKYFLFGLGSFLAGHVLYAAAFYKNWRYQAAKVWGAPAIFTFGAAMVFWIKQNLNSATEPFFLPVVLYVLVISLMSIFALFHRSQDYKYIFGGALVFMLSDSLIAVNKFIYPLPDPIGAFAIMTTYYIAQYLIVWGFFKEEGASAALRSAV